MRGVVSMPRAPLDSCGCIFGVYFGETVLLGCENLGSKAGLGMEDKV